MVGRRAALVMVGIHRPHTRPHIAGPRCVAMTASLLRFCGFSFRAMGTSGHRAEVLGGGSQFSMGSHIQFVHRVRRTESSPVRH